MMNRVILMGYLGAEPEKTETPTGKTVVRFSLPLHNPFAKEGDRTEWMQCEVWNQPANFISQYGKTGDLVVVEGRIRNQRYETKEGEVRYRTFVSVDSLRLRNSNRNGNGSGNPNQRQNNQNQTPAAAPQPKPQPAPQQEENIDDLFKDFDFGV